MTDQSEEVKGSAETDAELLSRLGTDGGAWGAEFASHWGINVDKSRSWFANAIEAGRNAGFNELMSRVRDAAAKLGVDMTEVYTPEFAVEIIHGHGHRSFERPEDLDEYLQELCDRGVTPDSVPILDSKGVVWLTYGEEHSSGGEMNRCWLLQGDPTEQLEEQELKVDGLSSDGSTVKVVQVYEPIALDEANYPVTLLYAPPAQ